MALESSLYADKGLTGLANVGNSCYINTCMQILSHTYKLSDFLKDESFLKLAGNSGNAIFLDSFSSYHRGGFCKSGDRITLRLCYQSHDALFESQVSEKGFYIYDKSLHKKDVNDVF